VNLRSVADMDRAIANNLWKLDRSRFDVVVGIPRSGMIAASIVATYLQMPLATLEGYLAGIVHGRSGHPVKASDRILLMDDTSNKGGAMARAMAMLPKSARVTRCAVFGPYQVAEPHKIIDVWFEDCRGPRGFAWNLWKHSRLGRWAFDFDGVLCRDPTKAENDDGPRYSEFLREVEPLFLPTRPIGHIVTGRLEKYRGETEDWLGRHGIECRQLIMVPCASKAERMEAMKSSGGRGAWKARIAREVGAEMFIESCPKQASIIARNAGIPVWCTGTQCLA
jgi:orotate phosphoribosyltransferase